MTDESGYTDLTPTPGDLRTAAAMILAGIRDDTDAMVEILESTVDNPRPTELIYQLAGLAARIAADGAERMLSDLLLEIAGLGDD